MKFVDAATEIADEGGSWRTLLFRGSRCLELNWDKGINYVGEIGGYQKHWRDVGNTSFASDLDAAVQLPNDGGSWRTMLFKGDQCLVLNWDQGIRYDGKIGGYEKHWRDVGGTSFASDLDAAVQLPNDGGSWRTMLFKGDRCLVLNWDTGIQYDGRISGFQKHWRDVGGTSFARDLDGATQLPNDGGSWRTMLFKGDQCLLLNWDTGIQYDGPVTGYQKHWPDAYRELTS
ncbi:hypothetical protein [Streptomyces sp. NPDC015345]|uniref:hypothetical protein n=1 Tax=Streptomyces sp. NPDC015345 TaxID=3364953 RepID=UPI0036FE7E65